MAILNREMRFEWTRLREALLAVLLGNAAYFFVLLPFLPAAWQHQPFQFDRGLALDFVLCLAFYLLLRAAGHRLV
ncbi:MAG: hypothetical protein HYY26_06325 [Acidobacteria bacterium]|nr:hypothetical protein [Acidobacteriota bacterium]